MGQQRNKKDDEIHQKLGKRHPCQKDTLDDPRQIFCLRFVRYLQCGSLDNDKVQSSRVGSSVHRDLENTTLKLSVGTEKKFTTFLSFKGQNMLEASRLKSSHVWHLNMACL